MASPDLSLIIPAYNEGDRLATGFARLERAGEDGRLDLSRLELLYVDDGSSDDTAARAAELADRLPNARVLRQPANRGKGAAVRCGVAAATAPRLIFTDADLAIDPRQIPSITRALDDAPFAVGSRAVRGHVDYGSRVRTVAGRGFNRLVRLLSSVDLRDTQCGFKAFRAPVAKLLFHGLTVEHFGFDAALLDLATRLGLTIETVPVRWSDIGGSHVEPVRHGVETAMDVLKMRLSWDRIPPLLGVAFAGATPDETADELGSLLAATDLVVEWDGGAAVLLPCETPSAAHRRIVEMTAAASTSTTTLEVPFQSLLAPRFGTFDRPMVVGL